jgi:hypothetical protein
MLCLPSADIITHDAVPVSSLNDPSEIEKVDLSLISASKAWISP